MTVTHRFAARVRPYAEALQGSLIREVSDLGFHTPGVIPLWFGESDRVTPPFVCAAMDKAVREGRTFYTQNRGIPELRRTIAEYVGGLRGRPIDVERVCVTASGMSAIMLVMQALVDPGDNVVLAVPVWPNCAFTVQIMGGEVRRVALDHGQRGWSLDLDRLFASCDERTRAIFLNSPGNPTGWLMPAEQVAEVLAFCRKRGIWAVMDEVYDRIVYDGRMSPSALDLATPEDPVISINSFSKSWCMTGWRLGWIVAPQALIEQIGKINEFNMSGATTFVQYAGVAAIREGEGFIGEIVDQYRRNRDLIVQRLGALPRVTMTRPEAAFYAFFKVDGVSDSLAYAKKLLVDTKVGLAPGAAFGPEGEGWLRLCFAVQTERLSQALDRLVPALS